MKKIILYILPFFVAIILFILLVVFINQKTGQGALQVTSTPQSDVYLDGKLIGTTPLCKCGNKNMIGVGEYNLRLIPKDSSVSPYEEKVTINNSTLAVVDKTFGESASGSVITLDTIPDKKTAQIMVIASPDSTDITLDDNPQGKSPLLLKNITQSDHELKLSKIGYLDKTLHVKTTNGYNLKVIVYLGASPSSSSSSLPAIEVSSTPTVSVSKILILDTPTGFLRVRDTSSLNGKEIAQVTPGQTFELLDETSGWYQIKLTDGTSGWISSQYAQKQ